MTGKKVTVVSIQGKLEQQAREEATRSGKDFQGQLEDALGWNRGDGYKAGLEKASGEKVNCGYYKNTVGAIFPDEGGLRACIGAMVKIHEEVAFHKLLEEKTERLFEAVESFGELSSRVEDLEG